MEEVDKILIHSLRQAGSDVPDEVETIKQFSTELIVEAVVRCLRVIDPSLGNGISHLLPPGMSARFRIGMSLAQACQDLGYQGEIGYQTFLYSNEPEIRQLFMFLVEKLPRESSESADQPAGKSVVLQRSIAARIKEELSLLWVPPPCRTPSILRTQSSGSMKPFHTEPLTLPSNMAASTKNIPKELKDYSDKYLPPVSAQPSQHAFLPSSLLERNTADVSPVAEWETEWKSQGLLSRLSPEEYKTRKRQRLQKRIQDQLRQCAQRHAESHSVPHAASDLADLLKSYSVGEGGDVLAKGSRFTHIEKFTFTQEPEKLANQMQAAADHLPSSKKSEQDIQAQQEEEVRSLRLQLDTLSLKMEEVGTDMKKLTLTITQVEDELTQTRLAVTEKEDVIRVKKRTVDLLPDAENNLAKLQVVVESSAQRVVNLASQWEKHRVPLIEEHRKLKELRDGRELESSRRLSEIKDLHERIKQTAEEARRKEGLYKQLLAEYENYPKDVSRSAYTHRILEIVGNIKKQKEEITKILSDTKELQKEINHLTGKLDRTFVVTDELVFKDAKRDEAVRKAYKYLAALHENCTQLIQTIEDTGTIMREIRDLEEQIETENGNRTLSNLERILEDYRAMKHENAALVAKMKET
ncbi:coiled-coil domain-containing protein 22 [Latimeria chalumnae]|uniref:coiled-coil domain-containing protein 22 n=1 Tax=Latimeria chalumnae TaxID=7897 RepID=UPI00313CC412